MARSENKTGPSVSMGNNAETEREEQKFFAYA